MNPRNTVEEYLLMWKENPREYVPKKNKTVYKEMKLQIAKNRKQSINGIYACKALLFSNNWSYKLNIF